MYSKLNRRTSKVHIVLEEHDKHLNKHISEVKLQEALESMHCAYWFIKHDVDVDADGLLKRFHYHIVMTFHSPRELGSIIFQLKNALKVSENIISINIATDVLENIRYLMHLDNPEKYQYDSCLVYTNDNGLLKEALIYVTSLTTSMLIEYVDRCYSLKELLLTLGLTNYKKYITIINTLWKEKYSDYIADIDAIREAKRKVFERTFETLKRFGLDYKCENFIELIEIELKNAYKYIE